jgi:hypothetical protein
VKEAKMTLRSAVLLAAGFVLIACGPALAKMRHAVAPRCDVRPLKFSWSGFLFNPPPKWNGCSPPVYTDGRFVGQDPDTNIRTGLARDPASGNLYDRY